MVPEAAARDRLPRVERVNSLAVVGDVKQYAALALKNVTVFGLESNYN
jgi:hypothetical protein